MNNKELNTENLIKILIETSKKIKDATKHQEEAKEVLRHSLERIADAILFSDEGNDIETFIAMNDASALSKRALQLIS